MNEVLESEYIKKMRVQVDNGDTEDAHVNADELLCEFLKKLGYEKLVDEYEKVDKWYA